MIIRNGRELQEQFEGMKRGDTRDAVHNTKMFKEVLIFQIRIQIAAASTTMLKHEMNLISVFVDRIM